VFEDSRAGRHLADRGVGDERRSLWLGQARESRELADEQVEVGQRGRAERRAAERRCPGRLFEPRPVAAPNSSTDANAMSWRTLMMSASPAPAMPITKMTSRIT
jgi:hypothetical protein